MYTEPETEDTEADSLSNSPPASNSRIPRPIRVWDRIQPFMTHLAWNRLYPPLKRVHYPHTQLLPVSGVQNPVAAQKMLAMQLQQTLSKTGMLFTRESWPDAIPDYLVEGWMEKASSLTNPYLLMVVPFMEQCMVWDERKVKGAKYIFANDKSRSARQAKYLTLCVGRDRDMKQVWISAHGFISWMYRGSQQDVLIQHRCHNTRCINPLHLEPGNYQTNHYTRRN